MKILTLRFSNLNSLKGEWLIDFRQPPFDGSNLFAITGATGAGKTTLLDAICLALYHRTPRQNTISTSNNPLMTHHTAECFAEVHFMVADKCYTAMWSQHRARKKPNGALQPAQMSIADANGKVLAANKTDVSQLIEDITELDFDRFVRSVMLAQGDFAAFLHAGKNERAKLLEMITGSDIYSVISQRVYQHNKDKLTELGHERARLEGMQLLSAEEQEALKQQLQGLEQSKQKLQPALQKTRDQQQWLTRLQDLFTQQQDSIRQLEGVKKQQDDFAASEETLFWHNKAAVLQPQFQRLQDYLADQQTHIKTKDDLVEREEKLAQQLQQASWQQYQLTRQAVEAKQHAENSLAQDIQQQQQQQNDTSYLQTVNQYLSGWQHQFQQMDDIQQEIGKLGTWLEAEHAELHQMTLKGRELKKDQQDIQAKLNSAESHYQACEQVVEKLLEQGDEAQLRQQQEANTKVLFQLRSLEQNWHTWREHDNKKQQRLINIEAQNNELAQLSAEQETLQQQYRQAQDMVQSLTRKLQLESDIVSLEQHRARLQAGDECPLCGSTEHPKVEHYQALSTSATEQELGQWRITAEQLDKQLREIDGHITRGKGNVEHQTAELATLKNNQSKLQEDVQQGLNQLNIAVAVTDITSTDFALWQQEKERYGQTLDDNIRTLKQQQNALQESERQLDKTRQQSEALQLKADALVKERRHRSEIMVDNQRVRSDKEGQLYHIENQLKQELQKIGYAWPVEPQQWLQQQRKACDDWQHAAEELRQNEQQLTELKREVKQWQQWAQEAAAHWQAQKASAMTVEIPPLIESAYQELAKAISEDQSEHKTLQGELRVAKRHLQTVAEKVTRAEKEWHQALQHSEFDSSQAFKNALLDQQKAAQLEQQRDAIKKALHESEARHNSSQERYKTCLAEKQTDKTSEQIDAELQQLEAEHSQIHTHIGEVSSRLTADAERREEQQQLIGQIEELEAVSHGWQQLDHLIGSASGDKYRLFAQGLTLDYLIHLANAHLQTLHGRYELQRHTDEGEPLGIMVLDTWQADAVRKVSTLSGGESFLVSLALALALSDLMSHKHHVGSLFLDEGFGTLDAETLDIALEALDNLNAQGKMIGVISHVEAMKERIPVQLRVHKGAAGVSRLDDEFKAAVN